MARKFLLVFAFLAAFSILVFSFAFADKSAVSKSELLKPIDFAPESYVLQYLLKPPTGYLPSVFKPTADAVVGATWYDQMHNAAMPKMVANDYQGGGKGQHFTWMCWPLEPPTNRYVNYRYNKTDGNFNPQVVVDGGVQMAGYTGLDVFSNSYQAVIHHVSFPEFLEPGPRRAKIALEKGVSPGAGTFWVYDIPDSTETMTESGMWPHGIIDSCGNIHVVVLEGATAAGVSPMGYLRCTPSGEQLKCEGPGVGPYYITKGTYCKPGSLISYLDHTGAISYIAVADPYSKKVALAWTKWTENYPVPDDSSAYQNAQDVWYLESDSCGNDWIHADSFDVFQDSFVNITRFQPNDPYRTYADIAGIYDLGHKLHLFWNAHFYKEATDQYDAYDVSLMHWSEDVVQVCPNGQTVRYSVVSAVQNEIGEVSPWAWNRTMSKMSAGVGISGSAKEGWLFCVWQQFDKGDLSEIDQSVGEIYFSFSTNQGLSWAAARNITNTPDSGCTAGNCDSEGWPSVADRVDDYMHIQYIMDRDAGIYVQETGIATNNPVMYKKERVDTLSAVAAARIDWTPKGNLVKPWADVPNNGSKVCTLTVRNIGTATLTGTLSETATWFSLNPTTFNLVEGPCPEVIEVTINASGHSETFLRDSIRVQSDDTDGNDSFYIEVNLVVSNSYYAPDWLLVDNGTIQMYDGNVGNIGHQIEAGQMYVFADSFGPVFDGSVIFGIDDPTYGKKVGRWIFEENFMLAESPVRVVEESGAKIKVVKKRFCPINPIPPIFKWRWITVEEYDKIFYSGGPNSPERFMKKVHLKVYKNPKPSWWGSDAETTNPAMYFGMAIDFDVLSDTGNVWNTPGIDETLNLIYQQGYGDDVTPTGSRYDSLYVGISDHSGTPYSAHVCPNDIYVYPQSGYTDDSLYAIMSAAGFSVHDPKGPLGRPVDYNSVMTHSLIPAGLGDNDTIEVQFLIVLSTNGLQNLKDRVKMFVCGNADRSPDGSPTLADVISMAQDVFGGAETFRFLADINGDCSLNLVDVIELARYCFGQPVTLTCTCQEKWED